MWPLNKTGNRKDKRNQRFYDDEDDDDDNVDDDVDDDDDDDDNDGDDNDDNNNNNSDNRINRQVWASSATICELTVLILSSMNVHVARSDISNRNVNGVPGN